MSARQITLALSAEPRLLTLSTRDGLRLSIKATNDGPEVVDPQLRRAELLVNGESSLAWRLAIGNGRREPRWHALPPGESVAMTWSGLGEAVLPAPGDFTLELVLDDSRATPIDVVVLPE
jgi:hypothetical protein